MNFQIFQIYFISIFLLHFGNSDIFPECENLTTNAIFIETDRGCSWFIFCNGDDSFMDKCEDDLYFNQLYQTCDPKEMVDCRYENRTTTSTATTTTTTTRATTTTLRPTIRTTTGRQTTQEISTFSIATTTSTPTPTPMTTTSTPTSTSSASSTSTDQTTIPQSTSSIISTISTTLPSIITPSSPSPLNQCPLMDNPYQLIFLPHPKSCSDYFMCYHGQQIPMHCSALLHFNVRTGKCDYPENVRCQADLSSIREQCQSYTTDFYPHPDNCNYYYFCKNGYLMLQQCPFFFGWDYEKRTCTILNQTKCYRGLLQQQTSQLF